MGTYVALLRGINVGGKNKVPMVELRSAFERAGGTDVRTYIQSGNAVFEASPPVAKKIPALVEKDVVERLGVRSPVILRSAKELASAIKNQPFDNPEIVSFGFCSGRIPPKAAAGLDPDRSPGDRFEVIGRDIYLCLANGVAKTKLTNAWFDKQLGVVSTFRNWRTVQKLAEMCRAA